MTDAMTVIRREGTSTNTLVGVGKAPTGIKGLDEVTDGGLPRGRTTLVAGPAGSGKTLLGVEFLVHGALDHGEPGVLLAFEETTAELAANVASLGFDLAGLQADGLMAIDALRLDPNLTVEAGEYDLDAVFVRLGFAVDAVAAKRVVLDSIEVLFGAFDDQATVRTELRRLFTWLKDRGLTAVVTGEKGDGLITRHGIEEYVSDCVITLDHRVREQISTRRLRVVKYRGSMHGTNEFPFLITERGIEVLPITSSHLDHRASLERVLTGVDRLDDMLGGGIYRGSSVLVRGDAGTGKTTLSAKMLESACARGERALFVSYEESPEYLIRNMAAVGIDLKEYIGQGLLRIHAVQPQAFGLEMHLATFLQQVEDFRPSIVALDGMIGLASCGSVPEVLSAVLRKLNHLKARNITALVTSLLGTDQNDATGFSSLMDTWLFISNVVTEDEQRRLLSIRKSRGTVHSSQIREFVLSETGLDLIDVSGAAQGAADG